MAETKQVIVKVKRQAGPKEKARWEEFSLKWRPSMNVIICLRDIAENPVTRDGKETTPVTYSGGFLEAECWFYPWLIATVRYDGVNSPTDQANGISRHDTRNTFTPSVSFLVRPNIKLQSEFVYNYEQPIPDSTNFYRANQFLSGVDFVF